MGYDPSSLVNIILTSLQFNAFLVTLICGFHGFAVGRLWKDKQFRPPARLVWLGPGLIGTAWSLYLVVDGYKDVATALSERRVLDYYATWLNSYWHFYVAISLTTLASVAGLGIAVKRGG